MSVDDFNSMVEETLRGSFDLHVHAAPDPDGPRRLDALEAARYAQEAEMGGFVLKSHKYPTAPLAYALGRMYPGLAVLGSLTLNREIGGLNPHAVEVAASLGARVVWMPTQSARAGPVEAGRPPGISLLNDGGELRREVHEVLEVVAARQMVLASGHVPPREALALFAAARAAGVRWMIATHPTGVATAEEQQQMVSLGAFVEHTFLSCMPTRRRTTPQEMIATIRTLGVAHCLVTTDFGQAVNPPPAEGMRMAIATLLDSGMEPGEVSTLVRGNPRRLAGLQDWAPELESRP